MILKHRLEKVILVAVIFGTILGVTLGAILGVTKTKMPIWGNIIFGAISGAILAPILIRVYTRSSKK